MLNKDIITTVIIPSYKVSKHIIKVINSIPEFINYIIVIDDKCPQNSGKIVQENFTDDSRVLVIFHEKNKGVGGAVISGYNKAIELKSDVVIKMDGDGQMDSKYLCSLINPISENKADYTKGNRFADFQSLKSMPKVRLFGNSVLSFLVKVSSGYWNVMDPTNGYTAINCQAIEKLNFNSISNRYFFESDMLINLNIQNCVVKDVPIPAKYEDEESSLSIINVLLKFPFYLFKRFCKRIFLKYFIYDFNMASIYIMFGLPMMFWGLSFGSYKWYIGIMNEMETPTGTVMLSVLPLILGTQFILAAINIDINSTPKK